MLKRGPSRGIPSYVKFLPCLLLSAVCWAQPAEPVPAPIDIVQRALRLSTEDEQEVRAYGMTMESIQREVAKDGSVKSVKQKTFEVIPLEGEPYRRMIRREGQPLPPDEARKEQEKFDKTAKERARETPEQRKRRLADYEEKLSQRREMFDELPKAFDFRMVGEEVVEGQPAWIIEAKSRAGYEPKSMRTRFLKHMEGRISVSKQFGRSLKIDVVTTGPVSIGWVVAKLAPGTRFVIEQMRLPNGLWVTRRFRMNYDVRVALVKQMRGEVEQLMWDFKRIGAPLAQAQ